uniref:Uncharacterized protein n=1 Tax=Moniliophthora roreri TaxID=221103 RepID=A0A0W0FE71_MONRR
MGALGCRELPPIALDIDTGSWIVSSSAATGRRLVLSRVSFAGGKSRSLTETFGELKDKVVQVRPRLREKKSRELIGASWLFAVREGVWCCFGYLRLDARYMEAQED